MLLLFVGLSALAFGVAAAEPKIEIDPNTRIEGGADVRSSGANAGAGAQVDSTQQQSPAERSNVAGPEKGNDDKDKPISQRKPQEREPENASKGGTRPDR